MASIRTGGGVSAIRGSIAGQTFSQNANGAYIRNRSSVANRSSSSQQQVRNTFGASSRVWRTLTDMQRESWNTQAPNFPYVNRLGERSIYTGFQFFVKTYTQLLNNSQEPSLEANPPVTLLGIPTFRIVVSTPTGLAFSVQFSDGTAVVPADCSLVVDGTAQLSNGIYRPKSAIYRKIRIVAEAAPTTSVDIADDYSGIFGIPLEGNVIWIKVYLMSNITGQVGQSVEYKVVLE